MCGIIGIAARRDVTADLIEGLRRLEYRGYDSAGIATVNDGQFQRLRAEGKLDNLSKLQSNKPISGHFGIGHTRWATHGIPNESNAHPHATEKVTVVHNGIIENFQELREALIAKGYEFSSQTDSEVIPVLLTSYLDKGLSLKDAVGTAIKDLKGAYAFAALFTDAPDTLIAARHGAPLAIGYGDGEKYVGSDSIALSHLSEKITFLEDGDWVVLTPDSVEMYDRDNNNTVREIKTIARHSADIGKGNYAHFMLKEIYEQPSVIAETLAVYYHPETGKITLPKLPFDLKNISRVNLVACGTSYYAGLVARYWLETIAHVPCTVDIASEFRYRNPLLAKDELTIVISQSGETADTLAALEYAGEFTQTLAIVNVMESSIAREADAVMPTLAGPEIGVASTKAFTTQLATLACFTAAMAKAQGTISEEEYLTYGHKLLSLSSHMADALGLDEAISEVARTVAEARDVLYLGRGTSYAIAHEGALKLKEISYIHAEAYAAGEMKHGPIALIDEHVPIIAIAPSDNLFEKTASNLQEAAARGGKIILISDSHGCKELSSLCVHQICLGDVDPFLAPIVYTLPIQLLAYHTALLKGTDVDRPRNLAKSVTVE